MRDELDTILDQCLVDIAAGRKTIDSCLSHYPAQAGRLAVLLDIAERARKAPATPFPLDKRRVLEARLLKRAEQLRSAPVARSTVPHRPLWRRKFSLVAASVLVVFALLGSVTGASAASVPGDFLYPVKRTTEQVRLALTPLQQQANLHLEFAQQRLQELRTLTNRGEVSDELLTEIPDETAQVLKQVPALPADQQQAVLSSLANFQDQNLQVLESMATLTQGDAQAKVMATLADSVAQRQQAMNLLAGAASTTNPPDNGSQPPVVSEETPAPPASPTALTTATDTNEPPATDEPPATWAATDGPVDTHGNPMLDNTHTPPGQANQVTPFVPPGQIKQATPVVPPGQIKQATPHSPSSQPTKGPKK